MTKIYKNIEYTNLVDPILNNEEFLKTKEIKHHGITRFEHSVRVSYYSYKVSKFLRLDYENAARGALLHDFFISENDQSKKEKFISTFTHPKKAVIQSEKVFNLNDIEKNIIWAHMFPIYVALPKYAESWVVTVTDKVVASYEFCLKFKNCLKSLNIKAFDSTCPE